MSFREVILPNYNMETVQKGLIITSEFGIENMDRLNKYCYYFDTTNACLTE